MILPLLKLTRKRKSFLLKLHVCHFSHTHNRTSCTPEYVEAIFWGQQIHFHKHANANQEEKKTHTNGTKKMRKFTLGHSLSPLSPGLGKIRVYLLHFK